MKLNDYILDHSETDWPTVLRDWLWLIPDQLAVWIMNRFGDLFTPTKTIKQIRRLLTSIRNHARQSRMRK